MNGFAATAVVIVIAAVGCGGRSQTWSTPPELPVVSYGLSGSVAILDRPADRLVMLTAGPDQMLAESAVPVGRDIVNAVALPDGSKLLVLSAGHRATLGDSQPDQSPSLTVIDGSLNPPTPQRATQLDLGAVLTDPLSGLAVDPDGHWAVLYAGTGMPGAFVENPNELVIVDLTRPIGMDNPVAHTLQSFGGRPVRLTFTPALNLPPGLRHLLVIETDQDVSLLQLENPATPEITVPLTGGTDTRSLQPAGIVVDDGDPASNDDARIGIRLQNDRSVITLQLQAATGGNGFKPTVNLTDVGGIPSDIAFVRTDGGLRLAALVPGTSSAVLVDPLTSLTTSVALPAAYTRMSLVTNVVSSNGAAATTPSGFDVALLWNASGANNGVAFWSLGQTAGQPYRSIETVALATAVDAVLDVPAPHQSLKVLQALQNAFYVLDLQTRTAAPLLTSDPNLAMVVSATGQRVWTFVPGGVGIAATDLATKHPRSLLVDRPVSAVHEIARGDGGRALIAIHGQGGIGATVFDAVTEDDQTRRLFGGLLTEGDYDDQQ
ncbi:MAG TPA: hypothetical protein VGL59_02790 [Polyangia bacterium]|jgi:hypothetical protein